MEGRCFNWCGVIGGGISRFGFSFGRNSFDRWDLSLAGMLFHRYTSIVERF